MAANLPQVNYDKREGYNIFPVSGAFGGVTPKGDSIVCQFYFEYVLPPKQQDVRPVAGQQGSFQDVPPSNPTILRQLQTGIYLTPKQAMSIGQWLIEHARGAMQTKGNGHE